MRPSASFEEENWESGIVVLFYGKPKVKGRTLWAVREVKPKTCTQQQQVASSLVGASIPYGAR